MSVTAVVARAGASRRSFYEFFDDREECFLAVLDDCVADLAAVAIPAYEVGAGWSARIRAALVALLAVAEHERGTGALVVSYLIDCGQIEPALRTRLLGLLRGALEDGRFVAKAAAYEPPALAAEFVVGGVLAVVQTHLQTGHTQLVDLVNPLMWMIVLPFLGPAAARRELTRTPPKPALLRSAPARDPASKFDIRLTYRTMDALQAVASAPGANNREIGRRAGVANPGQISKLLARLARLGLLENTGVHRGGANAWHLTSTGRQLVVALGRHSTTVL
jgi:AcrR family transcriptional regulator